jgi:hypothetical protein
MVWVECLILWWQLVGEVGPLNQFSLAQSCELYSAPQLPVIAHKNDKLIHPLQSVEIWYLKAYIKCVTEAHQMILRYHNMEIIDEIIWEP